MANLNKVLLMGNMTRDPQLSYLPSQTPVVEFGLATNRKWNSQDGQQREEVCFIDCRAYGRMADTINKYCKKGRPLMIEGRLSFDQWEAQDGTKRSKHRVTVENFTFVDSRGGSGNNYSSPADNSTPENNSSPADNSASRGNNGDAGDDVPF